MCKVTHTDGSIIVLYYTTDGAQVARIVEDGNGELSTGSDDQLVSDLGWDDTGPGPRLEQIRSPQTNRLIAAGSSLGGWALDFADRRARRSRYNGVVGVEGARNALRHTLWMALTSFHHGFEFAVGLGQAHERDGNDGTSDTRADLINNSYAARFGERARRGGWSSSFLKAKVASAFCSGVLFTVDDGGFYTSTRCK